jgi:hypothetical protein
VKTVKENGRLAIEAIRNRYKEDARFRAFMDRRFFAVPIAVGGAEVTRRAMEDDEVPGPLY